MRSSPLALTVLALLHYKPLHVYGLQQLVKRWGKDQVVNVSQRVSLHRTIDRLLTDGLIEVQATTRDSAYPERTVYRLTAAGRDAARAWLTRMLAEPKREFPDFPAAVSNLAMIAPAEARAALQQRVDELTAYRDGLRDDLDAQAGELPRVASLETEYLLAVANAELQWVSSVVEDLGSGRLGWDAEELAAFDTTHP